MYFLKLGWRTRSRNGNHSRGTCFPGEGVTFAPFFFITRRVFQRGEARIQQREMIWLLTWPLLSSCALASSLLTNAPTFALLSRRIILMRHYAGFGAWVLRLQKKNTPNKNTIEGRFLLDLVPRMNFPYFISWTPFLFSWFPLSMGMRVS